MRWQVWRFYKGGYLLERAFGRQELDGGQTLVADCSTREAAEAALRLMGKS